MNSRSLFASVSLIGLIFSGCKKSETETPAPPAEKTQIARPVEAPTAITPSAPAGPTESERKLAQQLREAQTRQLELELKLEEEKLAQTDAEIAREQDLLNKEREAWLREQEPAVAITTPLSDSTLPAMLDYEAGNGCDYQLFYDDLAPYGTWFDSADYGYVWRPAICVTNNSWRPYTIGSWANCDQGWAWCSDEPFGWACYHYGRWAQVRGCGWVWVPGDQWAPCWVSWRRNDEYIGWCPLPPETVYHRDCTYGPTVDLDCGINPGCYVFMPVKHFDRPCRNYCEAPVTCIKICASTVNITNIVIRPGRVECHGPKVDWIRDSVRRPVPRYTLARETGTTGRNHRAHRVEKDKLSYYAPRVQAPWNSQLRPVRHAALQSQEIVRADGGLPEKLATRFRTERMERERAAENLKGGAKAVVERQHRLAGLEQARESLLEQVARQHASVRADVPEVSARVERSERGERPAGRTASARAVPVPENGSSTASVTSPPDASATGKTRDELNSRREQLARQREDQAAAELQRKETDAASRREDIRDDKDQQDRQLALRAQIEDRRRQQKAVESAIVQQAAIEQQRRAVETASRTDSAAAREMEKQAALRAQIEEKRRQQKEAQNENASARAAMEQQRRASESVARTEVARNEAASRETAKQSAIRAAQEQQIRQAAAEAKAEQQARQREAMEQQRAANEQQRRQADAEARAEQQRREAAEQQRRQEEAESRRQAAQEEQRRNAEEQQQRRQAEAETRQRQVQEEQRRSAEEQQRRQADEHAKNAAEQQRRQDDDRNREEKHGKR